MRYAERFLAGQGLTWNDGEFVHSLSALLLVLLCSILGLLGVPVVLTMQVLSATAALAAAMAVMYASRRAGFSMNASAALGGSLLLLAPFTVWIFSGSGGVLFAAVAAWSVVLLTDKSSALSNARLRTAAALLGLLQLVRLDAMVIVVPLLLCTLFWGPRRRVIVGLVLPVLSFGLLSAVLQTWYYGTPVPHVALVKVPRGTQLLGVGLSYVVEFALTVAPLLLVAVFAVFKGRKSLLTQGVFTPLAVCFTWVVYLVFVGGDWMPASRHFAIVLPLLLVTLVRVIAVAEPDYHRSRVYGVVVALTLLSGLISLTSSPADRARDAMRWMEQCESGSKVLAAAFKGLDPLLAVEPAGCPPYVTGFRSLDMLGLTDAHISRASPTGSPVTWSRWQELRGSSLDDLPRDLYIPGHGNGDGGYVWGRSPDIVVICDPVSASAEGCFRSWWEMRENYDIESRYRVLAVDVDAERPWKVWVRHDAGPLSPQASRPDLRHFPAWLLSDPSTAIFHVDEGPGFVRIAGPVEAPPVELQPGRWVIDSESDALSIIDASGACTLSEGAIEVSQEGLCRVVLSPAQGESSVDVASVSLLLDGTR
jgi:hypothetical protein